MFTTSGKWQIRFYNLAKPNINLLTAEEDANIST